MNMRLPSGNPEISLWPVWFCTLKDSAPDSEALYDQVLDLCRQFQLLPGAVRSCQQSAVGSRPNPWVRSRVSTLAPWRKQRSVGGVVIRGAADGAG
jgi:hypothetical protein